LVDRLMGNPHGLIIRELHRQPASDLLRTPRGGPSPIRPMRLIPSVPFRRKRTAQGRPTRSADQPRDPVLDILATPAVLDELGRHRAGTTDCQPPAPRRPRPRPPQPWPLRRSHARPHARPPAEAPAPPATSSATAQSTPSSTPPADPSTPPQSRCCDDQLNPP